MLGSRYPRDSSSFFFLLSPFFADTPTSLEARNRIRNDPHESASCAVGMERYLTFGLNLCTHVSDTYNRSPHCAVGSRAQTIHKHYYSFSARFAPFFTSPEPSLTCLVSNRLPIVRPAPGQKVPPIKTMARAATILPNFVGLKFQVHNGKIYHDVTITEDMVGHKLGEFSP